MLKTESKILFILLFVFLNAEIQAEDLGRLFTTVKERQMLDKLRYANPVSEHTVVTFEPMQETFVEEEWEEEVVIEDEPAPVLEEAVNLKGVVYRDGGSNTAWINEKNTYDGNLAASHIEVSEKDIKKDNVKVRIPGDVTEVTLKVGETYQPVQANSENISDE